jgi:hypothetical protein
MKKTNLSLIAFLQALGAVVYCVLIAGLMWFLDQNFEAPIGFLGISLWLSLLVFSAGVTGSIVFGYPAYLALKQQVKQAVSLAIYTLLYLLAIIAIALIILILVF